MKRACIAIVLSSFLAASFAHAEPGKDGSDPAGAQVLFYDARNLMKQNKFAEACPKLEESLRLDEGIGTRFNLADCQEHIGKIASAWAGFLEVAARAKASKQADREKIARQRAAALEPRLPKLLVQVDNKNEGLEITRDGIAIGSAAWGTAIPIDPGRHAIRATATGRQAWETTVDVPEGRVVELSVPKNLTPVVVARAPAPAPTVVPAPTAAPSAAPAPAPVVESGQTETTAAPFPSPIVDEDRGSAQRTVGWVVAGSGLAALGVAGGFGIYSLDRRSRSNSHCTGTSCDATGVGLRNDAIKAGNVATVTGIAGGAAVLGGLLLLFTSPSAPEPTKAGSIRAVPNVAWGSGGVTVQGSFQ